MKIPKKSTKSKKKHKKIIKSKNTKNTSEITRGGNCENDDKNEDKESENEESVDEDSEDEDGDDEDAESDGEEVEDRSKMKMKTNEDKEESGLSEAVSTWAVLTSGCKSSPSHRLDNKTKLG